jgi:hypothetical protein
MSGNLNRIINMDKEKKQYETEWSFSFANLGESISNTLSSLGVGENAEVKTAHFEEALEEATSAKIVLEPTVGDARIRALDPASANLFEADVVYIGEVRFDVKTEGESKSVLLRQNVKQDSLKPIRDAFGSFARRNELKWDMRLSTRLPLDLLINNGVTANDFDLRGLQLTALRINGGTGQTDLWLPEISNHYPVQLNTGTGELNVDIPAESDIDLNANNGTGETNITIGAGSAVNARIAGGIGQCNIKLPADAALRLKATTGLGRVKVPNHFMRIKVEEFVATVGTWETPNYATAERKIDLRFDGGIGGLTIELA